MRGEMIALNFYTGYSILSGYGDPNSWVDRAVELGVDFLAIADKSYQSGIIQFQKACDKHGVPFAVGEEFEVFDSLEKDAKYAGVVALYATDEESYRRLTQLNNFAHRKLKDGGGFYYRPRIDLTTLLRFQKGLVCVVPNLEGFPFKSFDIKETVSEQYRKSSMEGHLSVLRGAFGDRLFLGVNPMVVDEEVEMLSEQIDDLAALIDRLTPEKAQEKQPHLKKLRKKHRECSRIVLLNKLLLNDPLHQKIPVFNAHYQKEEQHYIYDLLRKIDSTSRQKKGRDRFVYNGYLPSDEELDFRIGVLDKGLGVVRSALNSGSEAFKDHFSGGFRVSTGVYFMPEVEIRHGSIEADLFDDILSFWKQKLCPECDLEELEELDDLYEFGDYVAYEATVRGETGRKRFYDSYLAASMRDEKIVKTRNIFPLRVYVDRLKREWELIQSKNFQSYFHLVSYIYRFVRDTNGAAGPARGSAGGSLLAFLLGITKTDPLRHGLLFERFLSETRQDLPDIDMDFSSTTRDRILDWLKSRYGTSKIVNIGTFSSFKVKSAIYAAAEAAGWGIPTNNGGRKIYSRRRLNNLLKNARAPQDAEGEDELEELRADEMFDRFYREHSDWFDEYVMPLIGVVWNTGIHAAGVVILPEEHDALVPVTYRSGRVVTQFKDRDTEDRGFPKFDFLVVDGIDIIEECRRLVKERHGVELPDESLIPLDDRAARIIFYRGRTEGVFQFKTPTSKRLFSVLKPTEFLHYVMAVALGRPGPLSAGAHLMFAAFKNGEAEPEYGHEVLKDLLGDTYGLIVFQEDTMRLSREIAGFSGAEADALRKAIGKKNKKKMAALRTKLIEGAVANGYDEDFVTDLWGKIEAFGSYGFNLSHSVAYTLISFTQAYIQARYPVEFWTAVLKYAKADAKKQNNRFTARLAAEEEGMELVFPTIEEFRADFEPAGDRRIYWPLKAISGLGSAAELIESRANGAKTIEGFVENVYGNKVNIGHMDKLVAAGFFNPICPPWEAVGRVREAVYSVSGNKKHRVVPARFQHDDEFKWIQERNAAFKMIVERWKMIGNFDDDVLFLDGDKLATVPDGAVIKVGGIVDRLEIRTTRNGKPFAKMKLKDVGEYISVMAWSEFWMNEDLDLLDIRPERGFVIQVEGTKDSFKPSDSDRAFHQIKLDGDSKCRIILREKDLTADLFDD